MNDKVVPIVRKNTSCDYHRIILPFSQMGYDVNKQKDFKSANLVVFNRIPHIPIDGFLNFKRKFGFNYIVDVDDYWEIDKNHYLYENFTKFKMKEKAITALQHASAVIATTQKLADKVYEYNKNVHIIPNSIPFGKDQFKKIPSPFSTKIKFIYAGGHSHLEDIKLISKALSDTRCDFTLAGYNSNNDQSLKIQKVLPVNIKLLTEVDVYNYMKIYNGMSTSLVPLLDSPFNNCKSELKIIEAGAKGLAVIASKVLPYYNKQDENVIDYASTKDDWYRLIKYHMDNPSYVKEKQEALHKHVVKFYNMEKTNIYRKQLFDYYSK